MASFLITIDTEGDGLWSGPSEITTRNAGFLPRFQALCEKYGFYPTYLTNYEMATDDSFIAFGRDVIRRGAGEIGMHLHAWHSPPHFPLTANDTKYMPYLIEYPLDVIRSKIEYMTRRLEGTFKVKMTSHRAGRWAFDSNYANVLEDLGYTVDCSVTPGVDWQRTRGKPDGAGGSDYRNFPRQAYFLSSSDISIAGKSKILEVPMTIIESRSPIARVFAHHIPALPILDHACRRLWPVAWLRPNGRNLSSMQRIIDSCVADQREHVEFMLHSSELMPGGSPTFPTEESIERLYEDMDALFDYMGPKFSGDTLAGFYQKFASAAPLP